MMTTHTHMIIIIDINNQVYNDNINDNNWNANIGTDIYIFGALSSANNIGAANNSGFIAVKSQLGNKVMGFPSSHEMDQVLWDNGSLQVSYFKIFKQQKSTLCVFISNTSSTNNMLNIQISVKKRFCTVSITKLNNQQVLLYNGMPNDYTWFNKSITNCNSM